VYQEVREEEGCGLGGGVGRGSFQPPTVGGAHDAVVAHILDCTTSAPAALLQQLPSESSTFPASCWGAVRTTPSSTSEMALAAALLQQLPSESSIVPASCWGAVCMKSSSTSKMALAAALLQQLPSEPLHRSRLLLGGGTLVQLQPAATSSLSALSPESATGSAAVLYSTHGATPSPPHSS
jgi:hypothetical protein